MLVAKTYRSALTADLYDVKSLETSVRTAHDNNGNAVLHMGHHAGIAGTIEVCLWLFSQNCALRTSPVIYVDVLNTPLRAQLMPQARQLHWAALSAAALA